MPQPKNLPPLDPDPWVGPADLPEFGIDYKNSHLNRLIERGEFPAPLKVSPRKRKWRRSTILKFKAEIEARALVDAEV